MYKQQFAVKSFISGSISKINNTKLEQLFLITFYFICSVFSYICINIYYHYGCFRTKDYS